MVSSPPMTWKNEPLDRAAPRAALRERFVRRVAAVEQRRIAFADDAGIVEFMAVHGGAPRVPRLQSARSSRATIAEMQAPLRERCFEREQPGHGMAMARRHPRCPAPAPCSHRIRRGCARRVLRPCCKPSRNRCAALRRAAMQLRIAAGQPDRIGRGIGRLVSERRERHDLGAAGAPVPQEVRIDEGERRVRGERDALAGRRQCRCRAFDAASRGMRAIGCANAAIASRSRRRDKLVGQPIQPRLDTRDLLRLHQAEMPFRQRERCRRAAMRRAP